MTDVHFHPGYNAATLEYNIAVIKFNKGASDNYKSYISGMLFNIDYSSYVLRSVDKDTGKWKIPYYTFFKWEDQDCPSWSGIYARNDRVLICTSLMLSSEIAETECPNPYSAIYSTLYGKIGIVGLYSHSVIFGNSACGESAKWLNYYTYLYPYAGFAVSVLGGSVDLFDVTGEFSINTPDTNMFIVNKPADINMSGKTLIGGDIFAVQILARSDAHLEKRDGVSTAALLDIKGAVLAKNGALTSCEIALVGENAGVVSANCLDLEESSNTSYEVLLYESNDDFKPVSYALEKSDIHVHPGYDSKTLAYNLAVIEFNKDATDSYKSYIASFPFFLSRTSYTLRTINENTELWSVPDFKEFGEEDPDCSRWSGIYATNNFAQLCTSNKLGSDVTGTGCPNPYSAVYTTSNNRIGALALYSHSVIFGNNTCQDSLKWLNYYTYLYRYTDFIVSVLDRTIYTFDSKDEHSKSTSGIDMFIANKPADINMSGKMQIGGDIFGRKGSVERAIVTTPDLLGINGAILSKDGVATSCEIALIGSSAGFVSANCFEQKGSSSAKYEVLFYDAKNDSKPISYPLDMTDVRFHPGYDAATLEYNIAVIKFNKGASDDYTSYISGPYFEIEHSSYVLRSVDEETGKWRIPNNVEFQREDQDCPSWSGIYAKNDRVLLCTSLVQSPDDTETRCPNPYSAIYSMTNGKIGIVGLYSHSVIFGNSTCGESVKWLSYYTYLFRYAGFAVGILDRTIYSFDFGGEYSTTTSDTNMFIENKPADINMSGKTLIGGDIFGRKRSLEPSKSTEASQSTETSQSTGTTSSSPTLVSDIADSAQGLTRDAKIAIGVAVPLG
ncbi:hypothetical protein LPJ56_001160, partial [Coemansia sp. RSA 2599]